MSGGRAEEIAAVERARDRLEGVLGIRELVGGSDAVLARGRQEQAVVGPHEDTSLLVTKDERAPRAADTGIDDREVHSDWHELDRVGEDERTLEHRRRRNAVGDVDDLRLGRDPLHHAVTRADEVVLEPEVGQERDEHAP